MADLNALQIRFLNDLKNKFKTEALDTDENDKILLLESFTLNLFQQFFSPESEELDLFEIMDNVQYYIIQNMNEAFTGEKAIDALFEYANKLSGSDTINELDPIRQKNYLALITAGIKHLHGFGYGDEITEEDGLAWMMDITNYSNKKLKDQGFELTADLELIRIEKAD